MPLAKLKIYRIFYLSKIRIKKFITMALKQLNVLKQGELMTA